MFVGTYLGSDNQYYCGWTDTIHLDEPHDVYPLPDSRTGQTLSVRFGAGFFYPGPARFVQPPPEPSPGVEHKETGT